jgi:Zn-dependent peptidase ImmA (M78 family)/transcriptional regulator with XRE-family HTH domain
MGASTCFNHEMLTLARESRGLSQIDLARGVRLSQGEISKIETGFRLPNTDQVQKFAQFLRYQEDFFYLGDRIRNFGTSCVYHRKRISTPDRVLRRILAMVNVCRIQVRKLLVSVDLKVESKFQPLDIEDYSGGVEKIAQTVRAIWKLPPGPIQNLIRELEDAGGIVIRCDFGTTKVDAVSQWLPGLPPLFFVNTSIPTDRLRFTLAHEIGHIFMHQIPNDNMEKEADRFAAEFLMPAKEIKAHLFDLTLPRMATLKQHWRVSMSAILKRASELGTVSSRSKSYLWMQMGKFGYRRSEPISIPAEEPTLLNEIIDEHRNELGYSGEDFAELLYGLETALGQALKSNDYRLKIVG